MKKPLLYLIFGAGLLAFTPLTSQGQKKPVPAAKTAASQDSSKTKEADKKGPKSFKSFIKGETSPDQGLFTIYFQDEKYFFEIPDSIMGRDIVVVNRISRSGADLRSGFSGYAGDQINKNVIRYEKGPNNKVFLKTISFSERSRDSSQAMYSTVMKSNIQPIAAAFDVVASGQDGKGVIIDMTSFMNDDNDIFFFSPS